MYAICIYDQIQTTPIDMYISYPVLTSTQAQHNTNDKKTTQQTRLIDV